MRDQGSTFFSSIGRTAAVFFVAFALLSGVAGGYTIWTTSQFRALELEWREFSEHSAKKGLLLSELNRVVGFGGLIHNFKNYVVRADAQNRDAVRRDYEDFTKTVAAYRDLPLIEPERAALNEIVQTIGSYVANLSVAENMHGDGRTIVEIDRRVRIDDTKMLIAVGTLQATWHQAYENRSAVLEGQVATAKRSGVAMLVFVGATTTLAIIAFVSIRRLQAALRHTVEELSISSERFREMVRNSADAVIAIGSDGTIETFNRAAERFFGYRADEAIGRNVNILVPAAERTHHDRYIRGSRMDAPRTIRRQSGMIGVRKDGSTFEVELNVAPFEAAGQRKFIGVLRDISARKASEQALIEAKTKAEIALATRSRFFANVSHELRTPLNAIIGFSEIMAAELLGKISPPKYHEHARDINAAGKHLLQLITDLLDLSKMDSGEFEIHIEDHDLIELIQESEKLVSAYAEKKNIRVIKNYYDSEIIVPCDEMRMKQVFINIIGNAVKFTPHSGKITISCTKPADSTIIVEINDTGIGVPADQIESVLHPFEQADNQVLQEHAGTGLGLPLAKQLVELHGGTLNFDSELGIGSTVTISLPLRQRSA